MSASERNSQPGLRMNDYNNAFLGVILAGVLMLVTGLALLTRPDLIQDDRLAATERAFGSLAGDPSRAE